MNQTNNFPIVPAIIIAVAIAFFVYVKDQTFVSQHKSHINEYIVFPDLKESPSASSNPYLEGKMVIINKNDNSINPVTRQLPDYWRANQPSEASTVVWLNCRNESVGHYTDGADASVRICDITAIDKKSHTIIAKASIRGADPVARKQGRGDQTGDMPKIIDYLSSLPHH